MATAAIDDDEEDVLRCMVCLNSYIDPCTLQCNHSFCRRCITDYVKTQPDAVQAKTIPCPCCRQVTRVPDPSRPVDEWAGQLQPGHVVQELMVKVNKETSEDTPCTPCQQLQKTTPGKVWCAECEEAYCQGCASTHSVLKMTRDHKLCDINDKSLQQRRSQKCKEHKDQQLQLYCKDCNVLHCHLCYFDHHRKCDAVTIKSFVSGIKSQLSDLVNQFVVKEKKSKDMLAQKKSTIPQLNIDKTNIVQEIRSASQTAVDLIKKTETQLIYEVEMKTEKETNELKAQVKSGDIQMQTYRQYSKYIKQAVTSDNEVEMCGVYQVWKSGQLDISEEGDKGRGEGNIPSLRFSIDKQNITQVLDSLHLGEIVTTYLPTDSQSSPVLSESVDVRTQEDKEDPWLFDITVLEVEEVKTAVVTDLNTKCVKSFYTRNNKTYHSRLQFDNQPFGLTWLGDTNVMVAVPESSQIVTVAVTPDLVQVNVINTSKEYFSLAVMPSARLAAGGNGFVDILNMQGELMKTVTTHNNTQLFSRPFFMCVINTEHLLVTDLLKETVTCLTSEGQVEWVYSSRDEVKLTNPKGITTTSEGEILVADSNLDKVIQLSRAGEYIRDFLTPQHGLNVPRGICLDKHGVLYICDKDQILKFVFVRK